MSIPSFDTAQYLNRYSTRAVKNFLQPRGPMDRAYLVSLAFWFCTAIFFKPEPIFRVISFFLTIFSFIFGFGVTDGDKQAILNDLDRMLGVQAKFHDYYHFRMSNVLSVEKNPNFVLTQNKNDTDPKLLLAGSDDSFYINEEQPDSVFSEPKLIEAVSTDSSMIIDIAEEEITILDDEMIERESISRIGLDLKLEKLIKRIDSITKNEFIECMGFDTNNEFLQWLSELPDDIPIRVEMDIVYFGK
ncbi:MAG: hypothetical protein ACW97Z_06495 [Candidatus Hodarchaeales archaeon]